MNVEVFEVRLVQDLKLSAGWVVLLQETANYEPGVCLEVGFRKYLEVFICVTNFLCKSTFDENVKFLYAGFHAPKSSVWEMLLRAWFVGDWLGGDEIGLEAGGVGIEELLDAFGALGFQDEADVVIFGDAVGDFGIGVGGRIRMFLAGEREHDCGVVAA